MTDKEEAETPFRRFAERVDGRIDKVLDEDSITVLVIDIVIVGLAVVLSVIGVAVFISWVVTTGWVQWFFMAAALFGAYKIGRWTK